MCRAMLTPKKNLHEETKKQMNKHEQDDRIMTKNYVQNSQNLKIQYSKLFIPPMIKINYVSSKDIPQQSKVLISYIQIKGFY